MGGTRRGVRSGIISGGAAVVIWEMVPIVSGATLSAATGIYSLLPAFGIALAAVIIVSLCTKVDSDKVSELFERLKNNTSEAIQ